MENHYQLNDLAFETQFQNGTLDSTLFSHEAHLRLAWIHIQKYGIDQAIQNICTQIINYVQGLGAADKYNKTLTVAAVKTVYHFILKSDATTFQDFIEAFPRLKYNFKDLLVCHYSMDIFNSARAKVEYIKPDLLAYD